MLIISITLVLDQLMEIHLLSGMVRCLSAISDGLQLGPGYFGFTDPLTGTWRPKKFKAEGTTINDGRTWSDNTTGTWDSTYVRTRLLMEILIPKHMRQVDQMLLLLLSVT